MKTNFSGVSKAAAVVITYNADAGFALRLKAITRECEKTFVVDNGSTGAALTQLRAAVKKHNATLIELGMNTGIAHAQNVGLKTAFAQKNCDAVILFDHDSTPQPGFCRALFAAYPPETAIIGAQIFDINTRAFAKYPVYAGWLFRRKACKPETLLSDAMLAIASGTLISRAVYARVGGMREEFFIDYVDWEYCLRARREAGIQTLICGAAVLEHARGERTGRKIFGFTVRPPGYSLFRYRQIYRNRAQLFREYFFRAPGFICFEIVAAGRDTVLLLFEKDALRKIFWALLSWLQGFLAIRRKT